MHHLHSELLRYEAQKESLAKELLEMTAKVTAMEVKMEELNHLKTTHEDITQKYNALLQVRKRVFHCRFLDGCCI